MKPAKKNYPADALAEIRQIRDEMAAAHGNDLHAMFAAAVRRQKASGRKVVDWSNRKRRAATTAGA